MPTMNDFSRLDLGDRAGESYTRHGENRSGNFGQVNPEATLPDPAADTYPNPFGYGYDPGNRQFSSNVDGDPRALLEETRSGVESHADMNAAYGLFQPVATLGSHPWLRDELANVTERDRAMHHRSRILKLRSGDRDCPQFRFWIRVSRRSLLLSFPSRFRRHLLSRLPRLFPPETDWRQTVLLPSPDNRLQAARTI
jgi:hypothetical protein